MNWNCRTSRFSVPPFYDGPHHSLNNNENKLCGRPPQYAPAPVRCRPAPAHTRLACGAHRALLPVAVGAMNIHNVRDRRQTGVRQTDVRRQTDIRGQTASLPNALPRRWRHNKLCGRPPQYVPVPCKLTFDLLTLKLVSELRVTWATSVPILVFLGLSVLDLGPMYATDRPQTRIIA